MSFSTHNVSLKVDSAVNILFLFFMIFNSFWLIVLCSKIFDSTNFDNLRFAKLLNQFLFFSRPKSSQLFMNQTYQPHSQVASEESKERSYFLETKPSLNIVCLTIYVYNNKSHRRVIEVSLKYRKCLFPDFHINYMLGSIQLFTFENRWDGANFFKEADSFNNLLKGLESHLEKHEFIL